ncbi:hypothetical protein QFC22_004351 [Naganishia vaughanmartiniae]|uniref:Uncharacterized protein n=1 Tax=Naganishia vaughanmartiniae TaxID=1424756 RepID=A0ACC2X1J6_9TREE|nr:hypothetical protein QFC22_004351 [Naganishia vaughanmartiniae]
MSSTNLSKESRWSFAQVEASKVRDAAAQKSLKWYDIKQGDMPTSVHVQLMKQGEIPDPYKGMNEYDVQWVGEADWLFKSEITVTPEQARLPFVDLVFEGLDTICTVKLVSKRLKQIGFWGTLAHFLLLPAQDDKEILSADNMFISHRVNIKQHLSPKNSTDSTTYTLSLFFPSTYLAAKAIEERELKLKHPENYDEKTGEYGKPITLWNGVSSRCYIRKAQYGWGWDWGPIIMTVGPWKDILLEAYTARVDSNRIDVSLAEPFNAPTVKSIFEVYGDAKDLTADIRLLNKDGHLVKEQTGVALETKDGFATGQVEWSFKPGEVEIWWPVGHGDQPLYTIDVSLRNMNSNGHSNGQPNGHTNGHINAHETSNGASKTVTARHSQRFGFRSMRLVQDKLKDAPGTTFLFEVNGRRIFCGGSNWIPADNFLTEVTTERYRAWLELLVGGNQNMVRVWAGGIYEPDVFYDICDELGILVWQDFMFGCAIYPAFDELVANVEEEAKQVVKRLRNHPSMALFAGNNEDYQVAESINLEIDYNDHDADFRKTAFPARHFYEKVLPNAVNSLSDVTYHYGSPWGGKDSRDPTVGDIHQWNVWHGTQEPWHNWDKLAGRFVSEFGMEGYPDIRTVDYWLDGNTAERFPQSRTVCSHNKADGFERRLELYLMENFRHAFDMESYVYYTQVMQAEVLAAAYRLWRREWRGKGREYTAGALVWQINDCWPTTSWAIVDYFLRPKPAYFAVARELAPFTVGMARKDVQTKEDKHSDAKFKIEQTLEIWGNNSAHTEKQCKLDIVAFDLHKGQVVEKITQDVTLAANSSTEFWKGLVPGQIVRTSLSEVPKTIVIGARLIDSDGTVMARYANWPEPWKYIQFPDPELTITTASDGETLTLSCKKPIKGVILDVEDRTTDDEMGECKWSDQAIDMMPGDDQVVVAKGLKGRKVKARYLGDGTA